MTFADFIARLERPDGLDFQLQPWQRDLVERIFDGRPLEFFPKDARRAEKRRGSVLAVAAAIAANESVAIVGSSPEQQEEIRRDALDLLDRVDRTLDA